jgi:hypothetical protein
MEDLTQDAAALRGALAHLSAGEISPPREWTSPGSAKNKHSDRPCALEAWQLDVLRAVVKPETIRLYESFGYDMRWLGHP